MPTIKQQLYEEIINHLINLKTDKPKDQYFINNFLKTLRSLSYDVYNNNIILEFLNKIEVTKQYRQSVMKSEIKHFFGSVIQKILILKVITMTAVYDKIPALL